jgi:hypothetical protein
VIPLRPIDKIVGRCQLHSISFAVILNIVVIFSSTQEALEPFFGRLIIVIHISPAASTSRDATSGLFGVLQLRVDRINETTHGCFVSVVKCQRGRDMGVAELERTRVVLAVRGVFLELFLAFGVVGGLLLVGGSGMGWLVRGGFVGWDVLPGIGELLGFRAC